MKKVIASFLMMTAAVTFAADSQSLTGRTAEIYAKAKTGKFFADAEKLKPEIWPMTGAPSFLVIWHPAEKMPERWIVSLHGSNGFATDDLAIWSRHTRDRDVGLLCVQWWLANGDSIESYLRPEQIHSELDSALHKLGVKPGNAMLHGFSRGSANSYPIASLDAGHGKKYFSLCVASSGGVATDYPPIRAIVEGRYGDHPLKGTRWITSAGGRDKNQERDGIPAMRRTAEWLEQQGASVLFRIEDPDFGHGALVLNPVNAKRVLDEFLGAGK